MTSLFPFPYLLEASLILLLLYAFYFLVLRQKATPLLNRCYLLLSLVFALIVPALSIPLSLGGVGESSFLFQPASKAWNLLPELVISGGSKAAIASQETTEINWLQYAWNLYLSGLLISLLFTAGRLWKLSRLIRQYPFHYNNTKEYKIASTNGKLPTFSFLHYIFWDDTAPLSKEEAKLVLRHEEAHVQQFHSIDNIAMELLGALLWFNPIIYAYRYSLRQVHEHLADRQALAEAEPESYFSLLVKQTLRQANIPLTSQFFQHNTLNRIKMLQTKSNRTILRAAIGACIFSLIFFVAACEDENEPLGKTALSGENDLNQNADKSPVSQLKSYQDSIVYISNGYKYVFLDFNKTTKSSILANLQGTSAKNYQEVSELLKEVKGGFTGKYPVNLETSEIIELQVGMSNSTPSEQIFEVVEESPSPIGGMEAYYTYLKNNLKYPEQAKEMRVEGRVFVQFVVLPDGSVTDAKVVKGIGGGCDEAALEAVKNTHWNPGKQRGKKVAVRLVIPVMFKLQNSAFVSPNHHLNKC